MKTRSKSVTKNQRDKNEKQSSEAIVKKERVKECIPNEDFAVNQTDSFSESSILQLDDTIVVKQEECIDEKPFFIETISAKQNNIPTISYGSDLDKAESKYDKDTYCAICKQSFSSSHSEHTEKFHMKTSKPDIDDPNRTCRPCSYVFANKFCYRRHLLTVHKMTLESLEKSIPRRPKPQTDLSPVVDDPNHTCRSCEYQFSSRFAYRKHLWVIHKMKLERLKRIKPTLEPQPNISPVVDDPNNNCRSCNHQFSNKRWYRSHLFNVHKIRLDSSRVGKWKARQSISPVVDDPNYQFFSSGNYRGHVLMKLEPLESSTSRLTPHLNISPVVDDPDNNCRSCEYQFSSRYTYRRHLITIHKIKLGPIGKSVPKLKPQPNITPVVDDPNNNCRSCNYQFTSKNGYRGHLLRTHKMKLKPLGKSVPKLKPQPNITPVVDDPNNICQSCNYQFSSKYAYKAHLMRHRKLDLESLQKK